MEWTNMMSILNNYNDKTILTVYWSNGVIIEGFVDTISETCTCELDETDPDYKEYYMCVMKVTNIIKLSEEIVFDEKIGDLIELSILKKPVKIEEKGIIIWQ